MKVKNERREKEVKVKERGQTGKNSLPSLNINLINFSLLSCVLPTVSNNLSVTSRYITSRHCHRQSLPSSVIIISRHYHQHAEYRRSYRVS